MSVYGPGLNIGCAKGIKPVNAVQNNFNVGKMSFRGEMPQDKFISSGNGISNGMSKEEIDKSDFKFAKSLPKNPEAQKTTLKTGQYAPETTGYFAQNPETGNTIYTDENGRSFTEQAFRNWEQFAKDGKLIYFQRPTV